MKIRSLIITTLFVFIQCSISIGGQAVNDINKLNDAILHNDLSSVKKILKSGVDPNTKGSDGRYPLEWILTMNNCQAFKILLKNGANPNLKCNDGKTISEKIKKENVWYMKKALEKY